MQANAADFVQYPVSDLETTIPFYRDTLGLTLENHLEEVGWAEFALRPTTLALHEVERVERGDPGEHGVAVAVAVDDVEAAVEELRGDGLPILQEPVDTGVCDLARVADPDGNHLVLHRRHDGSVGRNEPFS